MQKATHDRPMRFLINHRSRIEERKGNVTAFQEMKAVDEQTSHPPPTLYGYLAHIQSLKPLLTPQDKSLPKNVRLVTISSNEKPRDDRFM